MDNLKIGDMVKVQDLVNCVYNEQGYRSWERSGPIVERYGWYVGYTYKQEGKVEGGGYDEYFGIGKPRYFTFVCSVKVLRIKFSERENDCFALPEDVTKLNMDNWDL